MTNDKAIVSWHLFGDGWDEWFETRKDAEQAYKKCDDYNLRLYKTWSYEDDMDVNEDYVRGRGSFPW